MKGPHVLQIVDEQLRLKHQKFSFSPSSRLESSPTEPLSEISWWWPEKWLAVKVHLAGGGLELEPPSTTFHYLPPRRVRTLVPYIPASDDSSIMISNTHRASEIQTNRGIGTKSHNYFWCCCNTQKWWNCHHFFYRTRVRSLRMLVSDSLTHSLTD